MALLESHDIVNVEYPLNLKGARGGPTRREAARWLEIVTEDPEVPSIAGRVVRIPDGRVAEPRS